MNTIAMHLKKGQLDKLDRPTTLWERLQHITLNITKFVNSLKNIHTIDLMDTCCNNIASSDILGICE
jgi:hypothetical protein